MLHIMQLSAIQPFEINSAAFLHNTQPTQPLIWLALLVGLVKIRHDE